MTCQGKPEVGPSLSIAQLTVYYDRTPALWNITCEIPSGVMVGVVGPNGAGKSTLLKAVIGTAKPASGTISCFGVPFAAARHRVAYVPQKSSVDWNFPITAFDLVLMGRYGRAGLFRYPSRADREAAMRALERVGMGAWADRQIGQLSGGQQQRLFLARAFVQEADLYIMDEPFAAVDVSTEQEIVALLRQLQGEGKTLFIVHHDLQTVRDYFDWVLLLNTALVASGPTEAVFSPHNIETTYGRKLSLLDEAGRLSHKRLTGEK